MHACIYYMPELFYTENESDIESYITAGNCGNSCRHTVTYTMRPGVRLLLTGCNKVVTNMLRHIIS